MKEYKLMYKFGAWVTKEITCAESESEAIFDASTIEKNTNLEYALFCGNKIIKTY